ncbi:hypothetical protein BDZ97DRAFT_2060875 [Flammula alnicola]|nr:hypothetical protein BDZ97DRAFT_2060875 [Flammula alnicola]
MSARKPFFPQAPARPASRVDLAPDHSNPLHTGSRNSLGSAQSDSVKETGSHALTAQDILAGGSAPTNGRPKTSGLGGLLKKKSLALNYNGSAATKVTDGIVRPGTADPHLKPHLKDLQFPQALVVAPTPQNAVRASSSLLSRHAGSVSLSSLSNSFKVPFSADSSIASDKITDKSTHISTSDTNSSFNTTSDEHTSNIKFHSLSTQVGPQRIPIEPDSGPYDVYGNGQPSISVAGHKLTENGRVKSDSFRQVNKRTRDEFDNDNDENYGFGNPVKRFKGHPDYARQENDTQPRDSSPLTEDRPSSRISDRRSHGSEVRGSPVTHRQPDPQRQKSISNSPSIPKRYAAYDEPNPPRAPEPRALEKLLGTDPDAYVKEHMLVYDGMVNKWTNCTIDEWVAGADEIAAEYSKMLDYVKTYVDAKLKLYGKFHANIRNHNAVLDERKVVLDASRKKLVEESGTVLA